MSPAQNHCRPAVTVLELTQHTVHASTVLVELYRKSYTTAGASHLHVEAAMAEAAVLLSDQTGTEMAKVSDAHCALDLLQVRQRIGYAQKHALRVSRAVMVWIFPTCSLKLIGCNRGFLHPSSATSPQDV